MAAWSAKVGQAAAYRMSMEELVGRTVRAAWLSPDGWYLVVDTDQGQLAWQAVGDCCANAYFYQCDGFEDLVGREVLSVSSNDEDLRTCAEVHEVSSEDRGGDVLDVNFYCIKSSHGRAVVEFRVEHNGYYGGWPHLMQEPHTIEGYRKLA